MKIWAIAVFYCTQSLALLVGGCLTLWCVHDLML